MMELRITIPKKCKYNVGIGRGMADRTQVLFGNTNDGTNWDSFCFPLPKGRWTIMRRDYNGTRITLKKKRWFE